MQTVSRLTSMSTVTNSTAAITLASYTIPGDTIEAGTCYEFRGAVTVARALVVTPLTHVIEFRVSGASRLASSVGLSIVPLFTGMSMLEGHIQFFGAGASAPYTVVGTGWSQVASLVPVIFQPVPDTSLTADAGVGITIDIRAAFGTAITGCSQTSVMGAIERKH